MLNFLGETFLLGLKNLRLHKLRSLLTALGIIFGVAAVIIMVAIGEGTKRSALEQIEQLGATNILVRSTRPPESTQASELVVKIKAQPERLQRICDGLPEVAGQVYLTMAEVKLKQGDPQQAVFFLERLLQAFPSSKHADMAQVRLSQIQGPPAVGVSDEKKP